MNCPHCHREHTVEGKLEGVSFFSHNQAKKFIGKGIYGIEATLCLDCGCLNNVHIDKEVIKKEIGRSL
jgi:hypothetical protein